MRGVSLLENKAKNFVQGVLHCERPRIRGAIIQPPHIRAHITRTAALVQSDGFRKTNFFIVPDVQGRLSSVDTASTIALVTQNIACPVVNAVWLTQQALPNVMAALNEKRLRHIIFSNGASSRGQDEGYLSVVDAVRAAKRVLGDLRGQDGSASVRVGFPLEIPSYKQRAYLFEQVKHCMESGADFALIPPFFDPKEAVLYLLSLKKELDQLPALLPVVSFVESLEQWTKILETGQNLGDLYVDEMNEARLFRTNFVEHAREVALKNLREFLQLADEAGLPIAGDVIEPSYSRNIADVVEQFQKLELHPQNK